MTKSAIDLAREALLDLISICRGAAPDHNLATERGEKALAALTTEPVPPDRERVAKELDEIVDQRRIAQAHIWEPEREDFDASPEARAAAILRQPAPAEIPSGIAGLIADIRAKGGYITCPDMLDFLNIVEWRFAQPAVGDWRDISSAPKDGTLICIPGGVAWWLPDEWQVITKNWPGTGAVVARPIRFWQPLPGSIPAPEEPSR